MIRFVQVACRCGEKSSVARDPMQDNVSNEADDWHAAHFDATGHRAFYRWTLERGAGRAFRFLNGNGAGAPLLRVPRRQGLHNSRAKCTLTCRAENTRGTARSNAARGAA